MKRLLTCVLALVFVFYLGDWLSLKLRGKNAAYGSVVLETYYAVKLKNGKTEYSYGGPQEVECVRTLLPHDGDQPCWYVGRKKDQQITIDSGDPNNPKLF